MGSTGNTLKTCLTLSSDIEDVQLPALQGNARSEEHVTLLVENPTGFPRYGIAIPRCRLPAVVRGARLFVAASRRK